MPQEVGFNYWYEKPNMFAGLRAWERILISRTKIILIRKEFVFLYETKLYTGNYEYLFIAEKLIPRMLKLITRLESRGNLKVLSVNDEDVFMEILL
jgi:hypothetical protein